MSNKHSDGGPAFPQPCDPDTCTHINCQGMSLRDWLAGQALYLFQMFPNLEGERSGDALLKISRYAYEIADAMLDEREKPDLPPTGSDQYGERSVTGYVPAKSAVKG